MATRFKVGDLSQLPSGLAEAVRRARSGELDTSNLVEEIAAELRAEGKSQYDTRWERERRFNVQLINMTRPGSDQECQQRLKWIESLSDADLSRIGADIVLRAADRTIIKTEDTLIEKLGYRMHGHTIDGTGAVHPGVIHRVSDRKGDAAFAKVFDAKKWSKPTGVV